MKVYAVVKTTSCSGRTTSIFFTSKNKALGYIIGIIKDQPVKAYDKEKEWYNSVWCYDIDKLFDTKNWNKYKYVIDDGHATLHIEQFNVL